MSDANRDQKTFWTDQAGPKWVAQQQAMDALLAPVLDQLLDRADLTPGQQVLDIGCGTGESTLCAAKRVGSSGHVRGADISATLLDLAQTRAGGLANLSFKLCDAATEPFAGQQTDTLISRFGLMFFENPVAAFRNMARALKPGAHMHFATWGRIEANPYFTTAAQAARETIGKVPRTDPDLPGPFAFRDPERVAEILQKANLQNISFDIEQLKLTPQAGLTEFAELCCAIGPAERALLHFDADVAARGALLDKLKELYAPYLTPEGLRVPAEINFFTARTAPASSG